jgi:hypothetical protein
MSEYPYASPPPTEPEIPPARSNRWRSTCIYGFAAAACFFCVTMAMVFAAVSIGGTVAAICNILGPLGGLATWISGMAGIVGALGWFVTAAKRR